MNKREGLSYEEKKSMMLSKITENGMRMTSMYIFNSRLITQLLFIYVVSSFLELVPKLFQIQEVTGFLSEKLSQDPVEKFFGIQRTT